MRRRPGLAGPLVVMLLAGSGLAGCGGGLSLSPGTEPAPRTSSAAPPVTSPAPGSPSGQATGPGPGSKSPSVSPSPSGPRSGAGGHGRGGDPFTDRSLRRYLAGRKGNITAAVYDARARRTWVLHPGLREYTASIVKVQIMGAALNQAQASGQPLPPSQAALMGPMIEASDNDAATTLLADVGGPSALARFDKAAGLAETKPSTLALIPGTDLPGWGLTTTTARDQVVLVARFAYPGGVLDDASRAYGLSLMEHVEADQGWGVSGGVPAGTTIALKNGWLPVGTSGWQVDSIGWVNGHGRDYVLAVLASGNPTEEYGIGTIETIARAVYQSRSGG
jgi:Beta-lactamase enzyme family